MIVLLVAGLAAAIYLVQRKTNIFPKAYVSEPVSAPIVPTRVEAPPYGDTAVTRPPAQKLTFTISPNVNCSYNNLTGSAVMISWINTANPVSIVELDVGTGTTGEPDIRTKNVAASDTVAYAPSGFTGDPEIIPGKKYYVRLFNGEYAQSQSFTVPSCMYTGR
ncbi:MAG: hypothetical protein UU67_C0038G0007 [Candidatus Daviesbacteria bacterium GW2011_GWB1_41_5]|uniref:Uncharacterized protein n=1 Tax=Candidatus Daviesbacteria bacterium GW2011_GWB1_41_5 TaxID=1618429 RepID=A0A0G0WJ42_9BACT|nr:MAG: hypothetical protein UU67_C0038G0007 [Candidatus Daviesbacteria bacterium GW2011_GWB1_41_5]